MNILKAFFRLIRWPNLVFIILTQVLFVYCIMHPIFKEAGIEPVVQGMTFILLCLSLVLIAAAGYIINDYFDLNIDLVNKPEKLVVDKYIKRRSAIVWHIVLSVVGIAIGFYLDITTRVRFVGFFNFICVLLLFIYSISLKRKLLVGNIIVALLTSWSILEIAWCETSLLLTESLLNAEKITRLTFLYAGFAFIISLIREVVKDMEDVEGDRRYNCRTMPIAWGMTASKVFVAVWLVVLIALLVIVQFYVTIISRFGWWISILYCTLFIIVPLVRIMMKLFSAQTPSDYHRISTTIKMVMLTGILSMIFFGVYS